MSTSQFCQFFCDLILLDTNSSRTASKLLINVVPGEIQLESNDVWAPIPFSIARILHGKKISSFFYFVSSFSRKTAKNKNKLINYLRSRWIDHFARGATPSIAKNNTLVGTIRCNVSMYRRILSKIRGSDVNSSSCSSNGSNPFSVVALWIKKFRSMYK